MMFEPPRSSSPDPFGPFALRLCPQLLMVPRLPRYPRRRLR
jgi:hypothetical protein